jgi:hypothetical protein
MVSALAVRNSDFASINSGKMTTVLSSAPISRKPLRIAYAEAPRKLLLNTFKARVKSRVSYTFWAVSTVGAPSLNSSVPRLVSSRSGVVIAGGIAEEVWAVASPATVMTVVTSTAANTPLMTLRLVLFMAVSFQCFVFELSISPTQLRSAARSWRRTVQAGCKAAGTG